MILHDFCIFMFVWFCIFWHVFAYVGMVLRSVCKKCAALPQALKTQKIKNTAFWTLESRKREARTGLCALVCTNLVNFRLMKWREKWTIQLNNRPVKKYLAEFRWFSPIFADFRWISRICLRFPYIFADFRWFSLMFAHSRQFSSIFVDVRQFSSNFSNFRRFS